MNLVDFRLADWLSFAAAPTFALMALLTSDLDGGPMEALCSSAHGASLLTGMVPMYLLMSAFHAAPWLKYFKKGQKT
ncbi:MAG: hypothetical protein PSV46_03215 [Reyranella sp.]|nr:hypothetical protein [Reyranella sp.]